MVSTIDEMNEFGIKGIPFIFVFSFDLREIILFRPDQFNDGHLLFDIDGFRNYRTIGSPVRQPDLWKFPVPYNIYLDAFQKVHHELLAGNTYLLNLTFKTPVKTEFSLNDIFFYSVAKYKLRYRNFTVFSPETFICIRGHKIYSFPMKGTINAAIPGAREKILVDFKEQAEHATIVDLIRNDLSNVADNVNVDRYRYVEEIETYDERSSRSHRRSAAGSGINSVIESAIF